MYTLTIPVAFYVGPLSRPQAHRVYSVASDMKKYVCAVLASTTEGDDKPAKYPQMFARSIYNGQYLF